MNKAQSTPRASDAQTLVGGFLDDIRVAYFRIAPERSNDLAAVLNGPPWIMDFTVGHGNFVAHVGEPSIEVRYSALLSLWAVAKAALQIGQAMADASRRHEAVLNFEVGTPEREGRYLLHLARQLIKDPEFAWPEDAPRPVPNPPAGTAESSINDVFLPVANQIRTYWWCSPPRIGRQRMSPASSTAREIGASFSKDKCVRISL
jgi:hypothetical protein